jgi:beta-lactamase class D
VQGTFVVRDAATSKTTGIEPERARKRFVPASTFKIPNSLIALETGAVPDVETIIPYGGKPQPFPQWEHDMPMREAIRLSAVPIYQEIARRVGFPKMQMWVDRMDYGNRELGTVIDQFWLQGPLAISALEQTRFLERLVRGEFQRSDKAFAAVREITLQETAGPLTLHAKTGWGDGTPDIGWWVGWIERDEKLVCTFALNIEGRSKEDIPKRVPLGRACLAEAGLFPAPSAEK